VKFPIWNGSKLIGEPRESQNPHLSRNERARNERARDERARNGAPWVRGLYDVAVILAAGFHCKKREDTQEAR